MTVTAPPFCLPSANRHAPGLRQHEDVHVRGSGGGHHQRGVRPGTLRHSRVAGGRQTWRPAGRQCPQVGQNTRQLSLYFQFWILINIIILELYQFDY